MRVRAEIHSQPVIASTRVAPFLVGRVVGADRDEPRSIGSRVIAPSSDSFALEVETDTVIPVPDTLETADALLIPPAAIALRLWRALRLELGEAAIYTDGDGLSPFAGLVAAWHGATPVIHVTTGASIVDHETVSIVDAVSALDRLRSLTATAPGVAAVDLSGRGTIIGPLIESLPRWGRLMLAGPSAEPFTTAFYTDIHRKGVVVSSGAELNSIFSDQGAWQADLQNATRLAMNPKRAAQLRACIGQPALVAASYVEHF